MEIRLTRTASRNLEDIYFYTLREFGAVQAERYRQRLDEAFRRLALFPQMGVRSTGRTRRFEVESHLVFYRIEQSALVISRVLHSSQRRR